MLSFVAWLTENNDRYSLEHKFDYYNQHLFSNAIPKIPITWVPTRGFGGMTYYSSNGRRILPGTLRIEISTAFKKTEQQLDSILIHEMIHAYLAVTTGDGDGKHSYRFQAWAHELSKKSGIPISKKDDISSYELADAEKVLTTVVMYKHKGKWMANFYSGTAFDDPARLKALDAHWGLPGRMADGEEVLVLKLHSSLAEKYGSSRDVATKSMIYPHENEVNDILRHGQVIHKILPGSVSPEHALEHAPTKDVLVVLQQRTGDPMTRATFLMPNIARDAQKVSELLAYWNRYYEPGKHSIEVFTTKTTLFNRHSYTMGRDHKKGTFYRIGSDKVDELRRNAHYIQRWN